MENIIMNVMYLYSLLQQLTPHSHPPTLPPLHLLSKLDRSKFQTFIISVIIILGGYIMFVLLSSGNSKEFSTLKFKYDTKRIKQKNKDILGFI